LTAWAQGGAQLAMVPEIRFEGFSGAWEQRKLGEVADVLDGA